MLGTSWRDPRTDHIKVALRLAARHIARSRWAHMYCNSPNMNQTWSSCLVPAVQAAHAVGKIAH
eukprot:9168203-Pyramimonas_sp.AAC.1